MAGTKDGSRLFASVVIDPIRSEEGKMIGFAKITRDITEKHEVQNALKQRNSSSPFRRRWRQLVS